MTEENRKIIKKLSEEIFNSMIADYETIEELNQAFEREKELLKKIREIKSK